MSQDDVISIKKCPMHMADDWTPPVPAWSSDIQSDSRAEVLYVGIQNPTSQALETLNKIMASVPLERCDLAMFTDRAGHKNYTMIAYFKDSADHVQWEDASGFSAWWDDDEHLTADYGLWMERYAFAPGQFETLISSPDGREGIARQFEDSVGPIREHGYWGGMEDRIPNSKPGAFDPVLSDMPPVKTEQTRGKRIVLKGPKNLCLIRSGQDFTSVKADELAEYNKDIAFGMQVFLSISHLQKWAQFHPTHLAIFNSFQNMAMQREGQFDLRLWHEVAVMDEGDSYAEYINCDSMTGLLPFAHAL